jgi:dihydroflavonol-4-reductase
MMHVAAIDNEATFGERFSATADTLRLADVARTLVAWDPTLKAATREAPGWLIRALAVFMPDARQVAQNLGRNLSVSGAKAERVFGFTFRPARDAIIASAEAIRAARDPARKAA